MCFFTNLRLFVYLSRCKPDILLTYLLSNNQVHSVGALLLFLNHLVRLCICRRDTNQAAVVSNAGNVIRQPSPPPLSEIPPPSTTDAPPTCQNQQSGDDSCLADNDSPLPKYKRDLVQKMKILRQELHALQPQSGHCRIEVSRDEIFEA